MANQNLESVFSFRDATRQQAKASILIEGLTGKGKSGLALLLGLALSNNDPKKVYAIDTENKSLDLFQGIRMSNGLVCEAFRKVDILPFHGYAPSNYIACMNNAVKAGADAVIHDSITHMWQREGGVLDIVSELQKTNKNQYTVWGDPKVVAEKQAIYNVVRDNRVHVICTVRVKEKFDLVTEDGKLVPKSIGEQELQMPDLKYEPDLVLHMEKAGTIRGDAPQARVVKSRYAILQEGVSYAFTPQLIDQIVAYLKDGADPAELLEMQRQDYIKSIGEILDQDASKRTMFPLLKEQQGYKDVALTDLPLNGLQILLGILIS